MSNAAQIPVPTGKFKPGQEWNEVEKAIYERRSVRDFKDKPVPPDLLRRVLESGRFAPSAGNQQPWRFIVIDNAQLIRELEDDIIWFIKIVTAVLDNRNPVIRFLLRPLTRLTQWQRPTEFHPVPYTLFQRISADALRVFHNAPVLVLLLEDRRGVGNAALDLGICGETMVLAAQSLGLGSCWVGLVKILMYFPRWRKRLGIRYPYRLNEAIAFGYMKGHQKGAVPRELQELVWFGEEGERREWLGAPPEPISEVHNV